MGNLLLLSKQSRWDFFFKQMKSFWNEASHTFSVIDTVLESESEYKNDLHFCEGR